MSLVWYDFEAGPEGGNVTAANSGALLVSNPSGLGTVKYKGTAKNTGNFGIELIPASTQDLTVRFASNAPNTKLSFALNFSLVTVPGVNTSLFGIRRAPDNIVFRLFCDAQGRFAVDGSPITGNKNIGLDVVAGKQYRVELLLDAGTTGTNGSVQLKMYEGNLAAEVASYSSIGNFTINAQAFTGVDLYGWRAQGGRTFDDLRMDDGSTTFLGPAATSQPTHYIYNGTKWVPCSAVML